MTCKVREINVGKHVFIRGPHRKTASMIERGDENELKELSWEWESYILKKYPWLAHLLNGVWRECENPRCSARNALYVKQSRLKDQRGWYCSPSCRKQASGSRNTKDLEFLRPLQEFIGVPARRIGKKDPSALRIMNVNPKSGIYGKIGKVVSVNQWEIKVDFREGEGLVRTYKRGFNLDHIVSYNGQAEEPIEESINEPIVS